MRAASVAIVALMLLPLVAGEFWAYQMSLLFLYAIAALGVGLCWGRAGFLPLGQGLFFGLSAYLSGLALIAFDQSPWLLLLLPLAAIASGALAFGIGALVFRRRGESGPYFSMITLALALLAGQLANNWESVTGGFNGLKGIPGLPGLDSFVAAYYVAAVALVLSCLAAAWLYRAPLGVLWAALAHNERRVVLFGFDTNRLKAAAFGVSGLLAGVGGALYAPQQGLVTPQLCGFVLSADLVIWAAVGGRGRLLGPVLGALLIGALTSALRDSFRFWEIGIAAVFIAIVLAYPQGLIGAFAPLERWWGRHRKPLPALAAPPREQPETAARLVLEDVDVKVGDVLILDKLSLAIERAGIFCVIGPNGAGKTSTFNLLTGELRLRAGRVRFDGLAIERRPTHQIVALGIGRKLQIPSVFAHLPIADNVSIALWGGRTRRSDLLRPRLRRWATPLLAALRERYPFLADSQRTAAELAHGERQILELALALLGEPRLLLLDEPCAGLSPQETAQVIDVIRWASERSRATIVVIEHDMSLVRKLADHVFVLHNGRLLAQGSVAQVQANPLVKAIYVGAEK
ncbi:MAG TPA: ATP-binding cassette domain-containing protein [Burkholderiaceae bacterium]|nr:ATP-binding cassette domain-containing protein [Burkholderiaceae bacterium]